MKTKLKLICWLASVVLMNALAGCTVDNHRGGYGGYERDHGDFHHDDGRAHDHDWDHHDWDHR